MQVAADIDVHRILLMLGSVQSNGEDRADPDPDPALDDLVRMAGKGDRHAFERLFDAQVDSVHRWLTRLVGPVPDREDLVQEVFLAVYRGLPRFRGDARFTTWLYRIVANIACTHLRRRSRTPATYQLDDLPLADPDATPEETARRRQEVLLVLELLERLTPPKRVAYLLRVVEGLSLVEIGRIVEAQLPAVGQRVKHARRELEELLQRHAQGQLRGRAG